MLFNLFSEIFSAINKTIIIAIEIPSEHIRSIFEMPFFIVRLNIGKRHLVLLFLKQQCLWNTRLEA